MQIKVISDTHNDHHMLSDLECDILIHCGDFGTKGNFTEADSFLRWFVRQPAKYKILVPGNHDKRIKTHIDLLGRVQEYGIHMLMNDGVTINGIKIWGGDFVTSVRDGVYKHDLQTRIDAWKDIPNDLDILVTHIPPITLLDTNGEGNHIGCDQLLEAVKRRNIKYHVFGHVHECGGESISDHCTTFINAACKNREYLIVRNYQEFNI